MKSGKAFFVLMIILTVCLLAFDWARNTFSKNLSDSPWIRAKTIFVIAAGMIIMRLTLTKKGFKLFIVAYIILWLIHSLLAIGEKYIHNDSIHAVAGYYWDMVPLLTPLPFIFFWLIDRVFFSEDKLLR